MDKQNCEKSCVGNSSAAGMLNILKDFHTKTTEWTGHLLDALIRNGQNQLGKQTIAPAKPLAGKLNRVVCTKGLVHHAGATRCPLAYSKKVDNAINTHDRAHQSPSTSRRKAAIL